jgi:membrane-associated phospholipid phosphatase
MTELVLVDRAVVQALNHAAQPQPLRLLVLLAATALAAGPPLMLAVLAVRAVRQRDPASLAVVIIAGLGGAAALGLNQLAGHLYFRPRPYWALPQVHAIGGRAGDSSFFSDHTTIAAAAAAGCLLLARRWGLAAAAATLLVALGRVTIGAHYPSSWPPLFWLGPAPSPPCCPYARQSNGWPGGCCASTKHQRPRAATSSASA